ncbi:MAG: ThiF family adenylyltransferase [Candidatus Dojkabacteria bacterium]
MIDIRRHQGIFNASNFEDKKILVIGCGAIGSKIVTSLIKLGLENITVYDHDKVESHNIANQDFNINQIGMSKVNAIKDFATANEANIKVHEEKCNRDTIKDSVFHYAFIAVDTLEGRKELIDALTRNISIELIIETRMGSDEVQINSLNGRQHYKDWLKTINFDKEMVEVSACGSPISFGLISDLSAMLAVNMLIHYVNDKLYYNRISAFSFPLEIETSSY